MITSFSLRSGRVVLVMVCVGGRCLVWWCCSGMVWSPNSSAVHRFTWQSLQGQSWVPGETGAECEGEKDHKGTLKDRSSSTCIVLTRKHFTHGGQGGPAELRCPSQIRATVPLQMQAGAWHAESNACLQNDTKTSQEKCFPSPTLTY